MENSNIENAVFDQEAVQKKFEKLTAAMSSQESEIKQLQDELQKKTDKYVKDIDALIDKKSKEIMTV